MKIGDKLKFGSYDWIILDVMNDKVLLITEDIILQRDYHNKNENITWKESELRKYLNDEFYNRFTDEEKEKIVEVVNKNFDNPWYGVSGGEDTIDKIFVLSLDEVVSKYFGDSSEILINRKPHQRYWFQSKDVNNVKRKATYLKYPWWWWVRTPGKNNRFTVYIHGDGNVGIQGNGISRRNVKIIHPQSNDNRGGVRPVLWMKI